MNKRKFKIYLAGAYSGDTEKNIQTAREMGIKLWELGYTTIIPHLNTYNFQIDCKCNYEDYIQGDLAILEVCDCIFMLPNWITSKGANMEKEFAVMNNIPVFYTISELETYWNEQSKNYKIIND